MTGGGSGIGKAIATELASLGCVVVLASRDAAKCAAAADSIGRELAAPGRAFARKCNIRVEAEVPAVLLLGCV